MLYLYHVSSQPGLKVIEPRKSSHKTPYVYATEDLTTALLFGATKDDLHKIQIKASSEVLIFCPNTPAPRITGGFRYIFYLYRYISYI